MINDHRMYKPNKQKNKGRILWFLIKIILLTILLQGMISHFLLSSYKIDTISMEPAIKKGDRIFTYPLAYGILSPFSNKRINSFQKPERGEIVLIQPPFSEDKKFPLSFINGCIKLFSLNLIRFDHLVPDFYVKRIIGIPGDTVKVKNYIAYIKPANTNHYLLESELIKNKYTINLNSTSNPGINLFLQSGNLTGDMTGNFSGNSDEILLNENEYFVLGDNRTISNDSRVWGKIKYDKVLSKIIFRYFPFTRIGIPK